MAKNKSGTNKKGVRRLPFCGDGKPGLGQGCVRASVGVGRVLGAILNSCRMRSQARASNRRAGGKHSAQVKIKCG